MNFPVGILRDFSGSRLLFIGEVIFECCALCESSCKWSAALMSSVLRHRGICLKRKRDGREKEIVIKVCLRPPVVSCLHPSVQTYKVLAFTQSKVYVVGCTGLLFKLCPPAWALWWHTVSHGVQGCGMLCCHWCQYENKGRVTTLWVYMASPLGWDSEWQWRQHGGWL